MAVVSRIRKSFLRLKGTDGNVIKAKIFGNVFQCPAPTPCIGSTIEDLFEREWIVKDLRINQDIQKNGVVFEYVLALKNPDL